MDDGFYRLISNIQQLSQYSQQLMLNTVAVLLASAGHIMIFNKLSPGH